MRKLRLICALLETGELTILDAELDAEAAKHPLVWKTKMRQARDRHANVLVVTTRIDVNTIIDMFMEEGQILSSDVQLFKES